MIEIERCRNDLCRRPLEQWQYETRSGDYCTIDCYREGQHFDQMYSLKNNLRRRFKKIVVSPIVEQKIFPHRLFKDVQLIIE